MAWQNWNNSAPEAPTDTGAKADWNMRLGELIRLSDKLRLMDNALLAAKVLDQQGVVAIIPIVEAIFYQVEPNLESHYPDMCEDFRAKIVEANDFYDNRISMAEDISQVGTNDIREFLEMINDLCRFVNKTVQIMGLSFGMQTQMKDLDKLKNALLE